jgi:vacuolar-type H+-ATPase subunit F/Vma7
MTTRSVRAIALVPNAVGFALAGVPVVEVRSVEEGVVRLAAMLREDEAGILLADSSIVAALPDSARRRAMKRATPVLVPVPAATWQRETGALDTYILDLLQRAVGYRVRLQ